MVFKGTELPNYRNIGTFLNIIDESRKELLKIYWCFRASSDNIGIRNLNVNNVQGMNNVISDVLLGFKSKIAPKLTIEGTGGTYFLYNKRRRICAIFKPIDEEAFAPCNPRGYHGKLHQRGFRPGVGVILCRFYQGRVLVGRWQRTFWMPHMATFAKCLPQLWLKLGILLSIIKNTIR